MIDWFKEYRTEKAKYELLWKLCLKNKHYDTLDQFWAALEEEESK